MEIYNGTYCVYMHTNKINGKMYVGQTVYGDNPNRRWENGKKYEGCCHFWAAIQKYGWNNFEHKIIASNLTLEEANNFEELLILKLDTRNPKYGYNIAFGGSNKKMSEETKQKLSDIRSGTHHSDKTKQKISEANKGENNPNYGTRRSDRTKQKISESNKGKRFTEESKNKMRDSAKKRFESQEEKDKARVRMIGKKKSDETRKKMRENRGVRVSVYSPELNMCFDSMQQAAEFVGITRSEVYRCCNGGRKHAGRHPITNELCTWFKTDEKGR